MKKSNFTEHHYIGVDLILINSNYCFIVTLN